MYICEGRSARATETAVTGPRSGWEHPGNELRGHFVVAEEEECEAQGPQKPPRDLKL